MGRSHAFDRGSDSRLLSYCKFEWWSSVVQTYFFDNQSAFLTPTFDASDPKSVNANPALGRTGYDLLGADGTYVAAMGTYDPGAGW